MDVRFRDALESGVLDQRAVHFGDFLQVFLFFKMQLENGHAFIRAVVEHDPGREHLEFDGLHERFGVALQQIVADVFGRLLSAQASGCALR